MKPDFDLIVRQVSPCGEAPLDVGILGGAFAAFSPDLAGTCRQELDGSGQLLMPGVIDAHVHFNEPGRTHWEGLATGSQALAAGGGTAFFDMPLNSSPPVLTAEAVARKRELAEQKSCIDFALWGGLTPDSLPHLRAMAGAGVIGFKAFLCRSGIEEFGSADAVTLKRGMQTAASLGLPVAIHAEDESVLAAHQRRHPPRHPGAMEDWLASRPPAAEQAAIRMALELAGETGADLHVVHVSHPASLQLLVEARRQGLQVSAETCPHYLLLDAARACAIGAPAKCAPPLRDAETCEALWRAVAQGWVDTIGSDHSPSPPQQKTGDDIFAVWGGISGCQHGFELLCNAALERGLPLSHLARLFSDHPARRFRLPPSKGGLHPGHEADFFLLRRHPGIIQEHQLLYRHPISPYTGSFREWRMHRTYLRGQPVSPTTRGAFLRPTPLAS